MMLRCLVAAFAVSLVLEAAAGPLSNGHEHSQVTSSGALTKRQVPSSHSLHERHLPHWTQQWTKKSKVPAVDVLPMRIGFKQRNLDAGHDKLMDISTPGSANYGKHMTAEEVIDFFAPAPTTVDTVTEWLVASGISADRFALSINKQWVQFDATAAEVEELLFAEFFVWESASGTHDISTKEYYIPTHVQEHIDYVTPGTRLRQRNVKVAQYGSSNKRDVVSPKLTLLPGFPVLNGSNCDVYITADCLRAQYSIPNATMATPGNELGIFESDDDHYSRAELDVFFSNVYPNIIPNGTYPKEQLIDGAIGAIEDTTEFVPLGMETPLDFSMAWPLIYPQKIVLYQQDDEFYESHPVGYNRGFFNTFLDAIDGSYCNYTAFGETGDCTDPACYDPVYPDPNPGGYQGQLQCGVYKPTNVISISYAGTEVNQPDYYLKRQCSEFLKLALQGTTVLTASGDDGVGSYCNGVSGNIFEADFPNTCPYILSVGGTQLDRFNASTPPAPNSKLYEVANHRLPSGGGFSNIFPVLEYQEEAVSTYFDQNESGLGFGPYYQFINNSDFSNVTHGVYHHGGRGYPDVSAASDRAIIYSNGSWWLIGGTSMSTPIWGAVLNLVNEGRLADNKSTVGFVHPALYAHPEAFYDITVGSNPGCNSAGFSAVKGWDPVTGLGSPNFPVLMEVLLGL